MRPERFAPLGSDGAAYLLNEVEAFEPDHLLVLPYVPDESRAAWLAVLAFAAEVIGAPRRVSNAMLGRIRLQWWRDALNEVKGEGPVRRHPVTDALAGTLDRSSPVFQILLRLIDGMEAFFEPGQDTGLGDALEARQKVFGHLERALATVLGETSDGEGLSLHALCRIAPDAQASPHEDGTETPARRFARSLAANPELEGELARELDRFRKAKGVRSSLAAAPLSLFKPSGGSVIRRQNPLMQKAAVFRAVLTGRA